MCIAVLLLTMIEPVSTGPISIRGEDTLVFLSQFDQDGDCRSVEYCGQWIAGNYANLNRAMVEEASLYIPRLADAARQAQEEADVVQANSLLAKHGRSIY
jgi:hypothetical protein